MMRAVKVCNSHQYRSPTSILHPQPHTKVFLAQDNAEFADGQWSTVYVCLT